jgi:hypothetical protein
VASSTQRPAAVTACAGQASADLLIDRILQGNRFGSPRWHPGQPVIIARIHAVIEFVPGTNVARNLPRVLIPLDHDHDGVRVALHVFGVSHDLPPLSDSPSRTVSSAGRPMSGQFGPTPAGLRSPVSRCGHGLTPNMSAGTGRAASVRVRPPSQFLDYLGRMGDQANRS